MYLLCAGFFQCSCLQRTHKDINLWIATKLEIHVSKTIIYLFLIQVKIAVYYSADIQIKDLFYKH